MQITNIVKRKQKIYNIYFFLNSVKLFQKADKDFNHFNYIINDSKKGREKFK